MKRNIYSLIFNLAASCASANSVTDLPIACSKIAMTNQAWVKTRFCWPDCHKVSNSEPGLLVEMLGTEEYELETDIALVFGLTVRFVKIFCCM